MSPISVFIASFFILTLTASFKPMTNTKHWIQRFRRAYTLASNQQDVESKMMENEISMKVDKFKKHGLDEQVFREFNHVVKQASSKGIGTAMLEMDKTKYNVTLSEVAGSNSDAITVSMQTAMKEGVNKIKTWQEMIERKRQFEETTLENTKVTIGLRKSNLDKGSPTFDILAHPSTYLSPMEVGDPSTEVDFINEVRIQGNQPVNLLTLETDTMKFQQFIKEVFTFGPEMRADILIANRDVMLNENFLYFMTQLNSTVSDEKHREILGEIIAESMRLITELAILVQEESAEYLRIIHDICEIAALHQHDEDVFLMKMNEIKPRFDTKLLAYLQYAITEEKKRLSISQQSSNAPSVWLLVLQLVEKGIFSEFEARYEHSLDAIITSLRFDPKEIRSEIFASFVNSTSAMELRFMKQLCLNMISGLHNREMGKFLSKSEVEGFSGVDTISERLNQLAKDVALYLSEEYILKREEDFRNQAAKQNIEVIIQPRNADINISPEESYRKASRF